MPGRLEGEPVYAYIARTWDPLEVIKCPVVIDWSLPTWNGR